MFTVATCKPPSSVPALLKGELITEPFSCVLEAEKHRCIDGGGSCNISTDGKSNAPPSRTELEGEGEKNIADFC